MNHAITSLLLAFALLTGCTKENAAFCCIDPADCASKGVDESRLCTDGLSCVENQCVASMCATTGCGVSAPVCDVTTDVCVGCSDSTECTRFPTTDVCDPANGACVECVSNMHCETAKPICDTFACRTCKADSECPSKACADDGTCVPEANAVYLSPTGTDTAPCSQAQPCQDLRFARQQVTNVRNHVVFASGTYDVPFAVQIIANATQLFIHGGGATLNGTSDDGLLYVTTPAVIRDLELTSTRSSAITANTSVTFERLKIRGMSQFNAAIATSGAAVARDLDIRGTGCGLSLQGGSLQLDRVNITGGETGICSPAPTVVNFTNVMVYGSSGVGAVLTGTTGTIAFMTIAGTGTTGTGVSGVSCNMAGLEISSSIVWNSAAAGRPTIEGGCTISSSIVGPTGVIGATNTDPLFVSAADPHLSASSPARDMANAGPALDFERDPRPRGARFDLGADEAP